MPGPTSPLNPLHGIEHFDVYIVDQQSVCVPLLRFLTGTRVVFYCHFPDKLLSGGWVFGEDKVERTEGGLMKKIYRWPIDKLEEWTTGMYSLSLTAEHANDKGQADVILSNSLFTSKVYSKAFPSLAKRQPKVVYPCIDVNLYQATKKKQTGEGVELVKS
jgi:alpha-1,3/alpha-1,6-mannosyltransferase